MKPEDYKLISGNLSIDCDNDSMCVEIEPAHDSLVIPNMYWKNPCGGKRFKFNGSFYREKQKYPGNDRTIRAKTFKYTKWEYLPTKSQLKNDSIYLIRLLNL